ncbi:MAG: hypothetical protein LKJ94_05750 [Candidatus Methanomethylophilus sp.]|jgi:hypothetical protein|nr:hypothetical protein [Methanomethylophilus sp.]MCI2092526.1 hypothetical protein [Methanomethylophilus sp.]
MSNPTHIKLTVTEQEARDIDAAVSAGHGQSRADLCRIAMIQYIRHLSLRERGGGPE